jgi:D-alanyl-D-alanine carboxypeptidase
MIKKLSIRVSVNVILIILSLLTMYHLVILIGLIPYDAVWGGRLETRSQMLNFELPSFVVNLLAIFIISIKGSYLNIKIPALIVTIFLWILTVLFAINTFGNIFSNSLLETMVFTPLTLVLAILCLRLAITKMNPSGIDNFLINQIENNKTPSVQYIIFNKDKVIHRFQDGLADIKGQKKTDEITTFNAYSVTKTFTALAILQLVEKGKFDIDENVKLHLPDFPYSSDITIRQLLNHSSGIPNPNPLSWIHLAEEHKTFDRDRFFDDIFSKYSKTKSDPNERFSYSNLGYLILGQLIEKVSGQAYEDYVRDNIIKPLGIIPGELDFEIQDINNHAKGYQKKNSLINGILGLMMDKSKYMSQTEGKWKPFKSFYLNGTQYGGLIGNPDGFRKYIQELLNPDCSLLSDEYKAMLLTENFNKANKSTGMCLSWFRGQLNGQEYFTHAGGGGGYYIEIRIYPKAGIGSVIIFNRTGMRDERILDNIDKYYFEEY